MSSSYEKSVKGATKPKASADIDSLLAPPKAKYIEHILQATRTGEAGVGEVFRTLQFRLRDTTWTIAFKALIVVHLMIREGDSAATLAHLAADHRKIIAFSTYSDVQTQGRNIRNYSMFLIERARSYAKTKYDFVGQGSGRLKRLTVDKGLLRETESVQEMIHALLKCELFAEEPENEISLTAFRLLTLDLLTLFQVMNEGTINILEHYFEMSRPDAERALVIYKTFAKQTDKVVRFLQVARSYEHTTRLEVPKIKHAPTSLTTSLEEYLHDNDFEINRRQYLAQQEGKATGKSVAASSKAVGSGATQAASKPAFPNPTPAKAQPTAPPTKGPAPDLIDFFESIEQNQQPLAHNSAQHQQQASTNPFAAFTQQAPGFASQQQAQMQQPATNFFDQQQQAPQPQSMQSQPTGIGFGGYTPQPQPQQYHQPLQDFSQVNGYQQPQQAQQFQQQSPAPMSPQATNPFRQQQQIQQPTGYQQPQQTGHNPFAPSNNAPQPFMQSFSGLPSQQQSFHQQPSEYQQQPAGFQQQSTGFQQQPFSPQQTSQQQQSSIASQPTGTNPFARPSPANVSQQQQAPLISQATGSTNPFRQNTFVNQQTGSGWQSQQGTMGGLENLETTQVFPRPGQSPFNSPPPQQQQQTGYTAWS